MHEDSAGTDCRCDESRVGGAIHRSIGDAYDAYRARLERERERAARASVQD